MVTSVPSPTLGSRLGSLVVVSFHVAMYHIDRKPELRVQRFRQDIRDHHRAVLATGTAYTNGGVALSLAFKTGQTKFQKANASSQEFFAVFSFQHVAPYPLLGAG